MYSSNHTLIKQNENKVSPSVDLPIQQLRCDSLPFYELNKQIDEKLEQFTINCNKLIEQISPSVDLPIQQFDHRPFYELNKQIDEKLEKFVINCNKLLEQLTIQNDKLLKQNNELNDLLNKLC